MPSTTTAQLLSEVLGGPADWLRLPPRQRVAHALANGLVSRLLGHDQVTDHELVMLAEASPRSWADAVLHRPGDPDLVAELLEVAPVDAAVQLRGRVDNRLRELRDQARGDQPVQPLHLDRRLQHLLVDHVLGEVGDLDDHLTADPDVLDDAATHLALLGAVAMAIDPDVLAPLAPAAFAVGATLHPGTERRQGVVTGTAAVIRRLPTTSIDERLPGFMLTDALRRTDLDDALRARLVARHLLEPLDEDRQRGVVSDPVSSRLWDASSQLTDQERDAAAERLAGMALGGRCQFFRTTFLAPTGHLVTPDRVAEADPDTILRWSDQDQLDGAAAGAVVRRADLDLDLRLRLAHSGPRGVPTEDLACLVLDVVSDDRDPGGDPAGAPQAGPVDPTALARVLRRLAEAEHVEALVGLDDDAVLGLLEVLIDHGRLPGYVDDHRFVLAERLLGAVGRDPGLALRLPVRRALQVAAVCPAVAEQVRARHDRLSPAQADTVAALADDHPGSLVELLEVAAALT